MPRRRTRNRPEREHPVLLTTILKGQLQMLMVEKFYKAECPYIVFFLAKKALVEHCGALTMTPAPF